jgi:hypothetical protein
MPERDPGPRVPCGSQPSRSATFHHDRERSRMAACRAIGANAPPPGTQVNISYLDVADSDASQRMAITRMRPSSPFHLLGPLLPPMIGNPGRGAEAAAGGAEGTASADALLDLVLAA